MAEVDSTAPAVFLTPPASAQQLPTVRTALRRWSRAVQLESRLADDMVLAVDEAMANAVEHAYQVSAAGSDTVTVFAGRAGSRVYVVVADEGTWRPPPADAGLRGRGVAMMRVLADHFELRHTENGTTVLLGWDVRRQ
ncbi:hypothetical protein ALI144C_18985 [Actinosynnema sp. ALI-1.44]|nr:hypothetical protein ALI144C_18985 [Actinosynnema sp. ALI-1.44]